MQTPATSRWSCGRAYLPWLVLLVGLVTGLGLGYALRGRWQPSLVADRGAESPQSSTPTGNTAPGGRKVLYWRSPMDPNFIRNAPGKDNMGMDLTPVYADEAQTGPSIKIDPVTEQDMGVRYDVVREGPLTRAIRTVGIVKYNETGLGTVTTKVNGWVQKLYVSQTGAQVHAGDPLFDFYSPQLYSAQEEFLVALRDAARAGGGAAAPGGGMAQARLESARDRLRLYDISEAQIQEIEKSRKIRKSLTMTSKLTGIVTDKAITEGQSLEAGMMAYKIADLSTVWVIGRVFEADTQYLKLGQEAQMTLDYLPGRVWRGRVTYIYPYLDEGTREVPVRMEFHNPGYELKPGMYATIEIQGHLADRAILVPDMAVINTGARQVAYVMSEPGKFEPRELKIGVRAGANELQVLSGLKPGEKVVVSGQFLIDSEASLRESSLKMLQAGKADTRKIFTSEGRTTPTGAMKMNTPTTGTGQMNMPGMDRMPMPDHDQGQGHGTEPTTQTVATKYVCPMPAHAGVLYDQPGNCPLCGMKLVPAPDWQISSSPIAWYTCPMPEHSDIHEPGPGKCPRCGMTLIPVTGEEARRFARVKPEDRPGTSSTPSKPAMPDMSDMQDMPGMRMDRATTATAPNAR